MDYFSDLRFFRFGHIRDHAIRIDATFQTYAVNFLANGTLYFKCGDRKGILINAPSIYWTWPGTHFHYERAGDDPWEHSFVSFTGERPKRWVESGLLPKSSHADPVHPVMDKGKVQSRFRQLFDLLEQNPVYCPEGVLMLESLLLIIHRSPPSQITLHPRYHDIRELIQRIEQSPGVPYDFHEIARELHMSVSHLRRVFDLVAGQSPVSFLIQTRMSKAAHLLRTTRLNIKDIAARAGYEDVYYFTRLFTRENGLPPGQYRQAYFALAPQK